MKLSPWPRGPANVDVNNSRYCLYGLSAFSPYATYRLPHFTVSTSGRVACSVERQILLAAYFEVLAEYVFVVWVQLHVKHFEQKCTACTLSWERLRSNVLIIGEPLKGCVQCFVCKLWAKNRSALLNNVSTRTQKPIRMTEAASLKHTCFYATFLFYVVFEHTCPKPRCNFWAISTSVPHFQSHEFSSQSAGHLCR